MSGKRVLVIGIDGGTWRILDRAIEAGGMPFLAELLERGHRAVLRSTVPANTPSAWTAFQTGLPPARSGIYDFERWDRATRQRELVNSRHLPRTLWEVAGEHGRQVGVLNLPLTFPPLPVSGFMVSGFTTPGNDADWTYPPGLKAELKGAVPDYAIVVQEDVNIYRPARDLDGALRYMSGLLAQRAAAAEYLIERFDLDLFMVHFHATDFMQHSGWYYLDPEHPLYEPDKNAQIMRGFYGELDRSMRRVAEAFGRKEGARSSLFVVSDHGFQRHSHTFYLGNWLLERGYIHRQKGKNILQKAVSRFLTAFHRLDVFRIRRAVLPKKTRRRVGDFAFGPGLYAIDWSRSVGFARGYANEAFVFLNSSTDALRAAAERMQEELLGLTDPASGQRVVKRIHRLPADADLSHLPDLIVEPAGGYAITGPIRREMPVFEQIDPYDHYQVGKHAPEGIFLSTAAGRDYPPELHIEQMAGMILDELGVPVEGLGAPAERAGAFSAEEEAAVRGTLEELGYV
ncbi:MAG: alkaline phosphatase family protein [Planctomycetota bacterium]|jgi:predicted AlkP superfamily phosphohydrolase/phosphomutase